MNRFVSIRVMRAALSAALVSAALASPSQAASLVFSSDCGQASHELVAADSSSPLGLTVSGPVSAELIGEGSCVATWTAEATVHLDAGYYSVGGAIDFDYLVDAVLFGGDEFGLAFLSWDISQTIVGTDANIAFADTIFWQTPSQSGHTSIEGDSSLLRGIYNLEGGDYTLAQTGTLTLNLFGGSSFSAVLDFPATSYVVPMPAPPIPEPAAVFLLGAGVAALAIRRLRTRGRGDSGDPLAR